MLHEIGHSRFTGGGFILLNKISVCMVVFLSLLSAKATAGPMLEVQTFRNISKLDGLNSNRITALAEDVSGRIWVGTSQGLGIYDSRSVYKVSPH